MNERGFWRGLAVAVVMIGLGALVLPRFAGAARLDTPQDVLIKGPGGEEVLVGNIAATTSGVSNATTGTPFAIVGGQQYVIQCDQAACIIPAVGSQDGGVTCTTGQGNTGHRRAAFDDHPYSPQRGNGCTSSASCLWVATVSGTSNCAVFQEN